MEGEAVAVNMLDLFIELKPVSYPVWSGASVKDETFEIIDATVK